ncbi:MAG: A/G-specific adenine glycosylase [Patescibacteria group bacterium]
MSISGFRRTVWAHYKKHGRHDLPWRPPQLKLRRDKTLDVYRVLVSEIMLQQTQVDRVVLFYTNFIKQFPTAKKLAAALLSNVLKEWQGLGYNRRAKMLHSAAKQLAAIPKSPYRTNMVCELEKLSGVGPYTARAVAAFAYNQDVIVIETNIRTVIIHHFFPHKKKVSDAEIEKVLTQVLPKGRAREWYSALMDYGAHLKRSGISHNAKSKGYAKQSKFAGSLREARGAILREYTKGVTSHTHLINLFGPLRKVQMKAALKALLKEGLVT